MPKKEPAKRKQHLLQPPKNLEQEIKEFLLPGEHVIYHAKEMFFTDRRIIKHNSGFWPRATHYFYTTFEDLDLRFLESIKAKNVMNLTLLFWGLFIISLGPISTLVSAIPGLALLGKALQFLVEGLQLEGMILIGIICIITASILRDRIIEFHGLGGTIIRTRHFHNDELQKVREIQHVRWRRLNADPFEKK